MYLNIKDISGKNLKALAEIYPDIIELGKSTRNNNSGKKAETELKYDVKNKYYVFTHNGKTLHIKKPSDVKFIYNFYNNQYEDINLPSIKWCLKGEVVEVNKTVTCEA